MITSIPDYNLKKLKKVKSDGFDMFVTKRFEGIYKEGMYERFSTELVTSLIREGQDFIDIGAHYGYYSMLVAGEAKGGKIFAIEPIAENHTILKKNIKLNKCKNIKPLNLAISDRDGEKLINVAKASDSSGFYKHPLTETIERREVKTFCLDSLFLKNEIGFVKIDTEGHELQVLEGMKKIIKKNKHLKLLVEFNPKCLKTANTDPDELLESIHALGFDIFLIKDKEKKIFRISEEVGGWRLLMNEMEYANLLCIKKDESLFVTFFSHSAEKAGSERSLLDLLDGFIKRGVLCHVFVPGPGLFELELKKRPVSYDIVSIPWWIYRNDSEKKSFIKKISNSISETIDKVNFINPHIIYSNTSVINVGAILSSIVNKPHVWHLREYGEIGQGFEFPMKVSERIKYMTDYSEKVIFNSEALKNFYCKSKYKRKTIVIYNPISLKVNVRVGKGKQKFFRRGKSLKLLLLGTIEKNKGQEDMILAVKKLVKQKKDIELVLAGPGEEKYVQSLKKLVKNNNLEKYVRFLGYIDSPEAVIQSADVGLMCSIIESFGRVTIEYMFFKKPVIGSRSGGTVELIKDKSTGLFYKVGDIDDLAKKINYFYENRSEIKRMGVNAQNSVRGKFTIDIYTDSILDVLNKIKNSENKKKMLLKYNYLKSNIEKQLNESMLKDHKIRVLEHEIETRDVEIETRDVEIEARDVEIETRDVKIEARDEIIFSQRGEILDLQPEVLKFEGFKKGLIWRFLTKYRNVKSKMRVLENFFTFSIKHGSNKAKKKSLNVSKKKSPLR